MKTPFNLPPGCSLREIDPPRTCERCDEELHPLSEDDVCEDCKAVLAQEEDE